MDHQRRILLVCFPGQGHINPALQFAKRLVKVGVKVTFLTAFSAVNRMTKSSPPIDGITVVGFSDGIGGGWTETDDLDLYMTELKTCGSEAVANIITSAAEKGQPFTRAVYTMLFAWVGVVARSFGVPSTFLWIQPAAMLNMYYYYHNGHAQDFENLCNDPSLSIELPGLPPVTARDLPSFMVEKGVYNHSLTLLKEHFELLDSEEEKNRPKPKVLVNTFDGLEPTALRAIEKLNMVGIGPLIPSAFLDGKDPSDTSFGADLLQETSDYDYINWLNTKPKQSVVYVSFGSFSVISKQQMEEVARGLLETGRAFLWVIRLNQVGELSREEELKKEGMIVPWCSQVEVLSHASLGCFVTHCGWNSSLESLVCGVPVVAFPQWSDQTTNAKLIEDVWKTGVRVSKNEEGVVEGCEIKRCVETVMGDGERGEEMRRNAKKWRDLAREAARDGGSSDVNLQSFMDEVGAF